MSVIVWRASLLAIALAAEATVVLRAEGPATILIPAGSFTMGSTPEEVQIAVEACSRAIGETPICEQAFGAELEAHPVTLSAYRIDRTEVTFAAYDRCVDLGRCMPPPYASGGGRFRRPDLPVVLVSWNDAATYCAFVGGRLPTEAEWERAARGTSARRYPWGDLYNARLANHGTAIGGQWHPDDIDGFDELAPVGSFPDGRTPNGIDDLAGNVAEWVADPIDDIGTARYAPASEVDPKGAPAGAFRVVRGGSHLDPAPWLRSAARVFRLAGDRASTVGFRCVHPPRTQR